jgi:isoleucyl-tRNA synthetase
VHLQDFPEPDAAFANHCATTIVQNLLRAREIIQKEIEKARQAKLIGSNLEAAVTLHLASNDPAVVIQDHLAEAEEFLILSALRLQIEPAGTEAAARVEKNSDRKCERCWRHRPEVGHHAEHPTLCGRCVDVISA